MVHLENKYYVTVIKYKLMKVAYTERGGEYHGQRNETEEERV